MDQNYTREIETEFANRFPETWETKDVENLIGLTEFTRDIGALNETLNIPIRDFILRGGKRLRPVLFLTLLQGFDVEDFMQHIDVAYAIELTHNGTLVIDDVEDDSELRRGKPTLHKTFGLDVAVNAGVAMHLLPLVVFTQKNKRLSDAQRLRLLEIFSEEIINVYFGQATDIAWHRNSDKKVSESEYLEMSRLKTGSLMRMSARSACALANKDEKTENLFKQYAESAGIAFQIKDDVLDLTAKEEKFGKAFGNDISEGKMSLPIIYALEELVDEQADRMREILSMHTREKNLIKEVQTLLQGTQAIERSTDFANQLFLDAWSKVEKIIPNEEGKAKLQELTESFVKREH